MDDIVCAAAGMHNTISAAAKAFSKVGSSSLCHSSAHCTVTICRAFGVRHASTFKVVTLFPSLIARPAHSPPQWTPRRGGGHICRETARRASRWGGVYSQRTRGGHRGGGGIFAGGKMGLSVVVVERGCSKLFSPPRS